MDCVRIAAIALSAVLVVMTLPLSLFWCLKVVQEYERAAIFRLGRLDKNAARGPGVIFLLPCVDSFCKVDLRTVAIDIRPQEILTRDSVSVTVDAVVYYRIEHAVNAVFMMSNVGYSTRLLAMTTLRKVLGTRNLSEILSQLDVISQVMQVILDSGTDRWGVKVERVEIKNLRLPVHLQRSMATEAEASREAKAQVIAADGEMKASRALKEAANMINESPVALQLRYLQTLSTISAEKSTTIIFPVPIDFLSVFKNPNSL